MSVKEARLQMWKHTDIYREKQPPPRTSSTQKLAPSNYLYIADLITTCCQVDSIMLLSR